ncbi:MAG: M48 family metallopeptidase [Dysgonamonadaceae bacterium]|jgi:predicted Zn-dependent protease|nr:M48 family metallopeptidase [Dysgonamonadaceae bacterium]
MKKYFLLFAMAAGLYACSSVPITGRQQLNLVSDDEVLSLSLQQYNDYIQTAKKSTDKTATALVEKVGRKIADAVEAYFAATNQTQLIAGYQWEFNLVNDSQVNAFCMPGGKIVVYTGILPYTKDETGLAVVLGHEVGHAIAKHANERMSQQMAAQYGSAAVNALLSKSSSTVQSVGSVVYGLGAEVGVMLPFNRKQELEADHLGLILMAIAGYDPNTAIPFWERMSQQGNNGTFEFLSTHPSDATRIAEIRKELPEATEYYQTVNGKKNTTTPSGSNTNNQWRF